MCTSFHIHVLDVACVSNLTAKIDCFEDSPSGWRYLSDGSFVLHDVDRTDARMSETATVLGESFDRFRSSLAILFPARCNVLGAFCSNFHGYKTGFEVFLAA